MKNSLPKERMPKLLSTVIAGRTKYFPRIYRFIPEGIISTKVFHYIVLVTVTVLSILLVMQIIQQSVQLRENLEREKQLQQERINILSEINRLKYAESQYSGYRDIYYRIATLQYKLGNIDESRSYVKKALEIDPNFKDGQVLGEKIGL